MNMNRHFLVISLNKSNYFIQGLFLFYIFKNFRNKKVKYFI